MLKIGDRAPDFSLFDQNNNIHTLSNKKGNWVFIYFYPKDNTPGCTQEACSIRDNYEQIANKGAIVFGISPDSITSHKKFEQNHALNFALLSDSEKEVVNNYGVWKEKSFMGKKYMGVERTSFIIDPKGEIAKIYPKVNPKEHIAEVVNDLTQLTGH